MPAPEPHRHEVAVSGPARYSVTVGGALDHVNTVRYYYWFGKYHVRELPWFQPNVSVRIANVGPSLVKGVRLVANGAGDWYDIDSLLAEVIGARVTDREKAMALFGFFARSAIQSHNNYMRCGPWSPDYSRSPSANEFKWRSDPVRAVTCFYTGGCGVTAANLAIAARCAGLDARVVTFSRPGIPFNGQHAATEIWYDDGYHLFDAELRVFFRCRDKITVASAEQIIRDPELVKRTHCLGPAGPQFPLGDFWFDLLYDCGLPIGVMPVDPWAADLNVDLRPGEYFEMRWSNCGNFWYGDKESNDVPQVPWRLSNSVIRLDVDGTSSRSVRNLTAAENVTASPDGFRLEDPGYDGQIVVRMSAPFPVVGGAIELTGTPPEVMISVAQRAEPWRAVAPPHDLDSVISLDDVLDHVRGTALSEFHVRMVIPRGTAEPLRGFSVEAVVQLSDAALPALRAGHNELAYRDTCGAARREVVITHLWRERDHAGVPGPPAPTSPGRASQPVPRDDAVLSWNSATDLAGHPVRVGTYHVCVADTERSPVPVSTNLDRLTFSDATSWPVPAGWLREGERYVWRVRACAADHVWSAWSPWQEFVTR